MDLSIIVPIYDVEKYVRTCIESIYKQGLDEKTFEVILVNDGTTDNSMEVIADIINQHSNIVIINQENQGLSVARNNGIAIAKGEYILMTDSDDFLIEYSLKPLLDIALKSDTDLVVADFLKMTSEEIDNYKGIVQQKMIATEKTGWQMLLEDLGPYESYVWRNLYRRSFIIDNQLEFIPGIRFQDMPFTYEVYLKADRCIRTSRTLYIYRVGRENAATTGFDLIRAKDFCKALGAAWKLTYIKGLPTKVMIKLKDNIHANMSGMIYSTLYTIQNTKDQVKVIHLLRKEAPDMKFNHNLPQRIETIFIRNTPYLYIYIRKIIRKWKKTKFNPLSILLFIL